MLISLICAIHCFTLSAFSAKKVSVSWQAKWAQEGLQTDALSVENGTIISAAARWPLLIDPQLQGIKWIIGKEAPNGLRIIQQSEHNYIDKVRSLFFFMFSFILGSEDVLRRALPDVCCNAHVLKGIINLLGMNPLLVWHTGDTLY